MKVSFRPKWLPTLATIILAPMLAGLGFWQLDRSEQKSTSLQLYQTRAQSPAVTIGAALEAPGEIEYRQVRTDGVWDQSREFFLDNQILDGRPGYHVITPILLKGSNTAVLVNRGWIPAAADRSILPETADLAGESELSGIAVIPPQDTFMLKDEEPLVDRWLPIWQTLDLARFSDNAPYPVQAFVILLDPAHTDGYERQWKPPTDEWIYRHQAYAFQWFALCAALLVIYFLFAFRPRQAS